MTEASPRMRYSSDESYRSRSSNSEDSDSRGQNRDDYISDYDNKRVNFYSKNVAVNGNNRKGTKMSNGASSLTNKTGKKPLALVRGLRRGNSFPPKGGGGDASSSAVATMGQVSKRVISANKIKMGELRNMNLELVDALRMNEANQRDMVRTIRKLERQLKLCNEQENSMPTIVQRQTAEASAMHDQIRKLKEAVKQKDKKLKETFDELDQKQRILKKLKMLVEDQNLKERDQLNNQLMRVEQELTEKSHIIKDLERHIENLNKNHKHELGIKKAKEQAMNSRLKQYELQLEKSNSQLQEKEKEFAVLNIYSQTRSQQEQRQLLNRPPHRLNGSIRSTPVSFDSSRVKKNNLMPENNKNNGNVQQADLIRGDQLKSNGSLTNNSNTNNKPNNTKKRQSSSGSNRINKSQQQQQGGKLSSSNINDTQFISSSNINKDEQILSGSDIVQKMKTIQPKQLQQAQKTNNNNNTASESGTDKLEDVDRRIKEIETNARSIVEQQKVENNYKLEREMSELREKRFQEEKMKREREERERLVKVEKDKFLRSREYEEKEKQKEILLAKMRAIDENNGKKELIMEDPFSDKNNILNSNSLSSTTKSQAQNQSSKITSSIKKADSIFDVDQMSIGTYKPSFLNDEQNNSPFKQQKPVTTINNNSADKKKNNPSSNHLPLDNINNKKSRNEYSGKYKVYSLFSEDEDESQDDENVIQQQSFPSKNKFITNTMANGSESPDVLFSLNNNDKFKNDKDKDKNRDKNKDTKSGGKKLYSDANTGNSYMDKERIDADKKKALLPKRYKLPNSNLNAIDSDDDE